VCLFIYIYIYIYIYKCVWHILETELNSATKELIKRSERPVSTVY